MKWLRAFSRGSDALGRGQPHVFDGGASSFTIAGGLFDLQVFDEVVTEGGFFNVGTEWDLHGSASYVVIPEPGSVLLAGLGLALLAGRRRRR